MSSSCQVASVLSETCHILERGNEYTNILYKVQVEKQSVILAMYPYLLPTNDLLEPSILVILTLL